MDDDESAASRAHPTSADEPRGDPAEEPEQQQPPVEDDAPSDPVDPGVAREMFGDLYADETTHGPAQFGSHNTMHNHHYGKESFDPIIGPLPGIEDLMEVYVATGSDEDLDDHMAQRSTVCLVGPRHSGRYSTARAALGRRYKPGQVYEIELPTDVPPEALNAKPDRLPENSGYVLRLPGDGHADAMRRLASLFRRRCSTLLLIKDENPRQWDRRGAEVRHQAPDPIDVFRNHLAATLPEVGHDVIEGYLTEEVKAELKAVYSPKESVAVAHAIAKERPANDETVRTVLDRSQRRRRERATAILLPSKDGPAARGRRAGQHERAFRLSYAVFYRRPLHYVFEAADWLLREIDSAALRPDWGSMALQHPVRDLLGDELTQDWAAGCRAGTATQGATRTAWIRDPGLRGAIIDVAWHDFDGTRRSLMKWLDRLVVSGDEVMRRAAAETAGLLVHHDFARVHKDLVDPWAGSRRAAVRQAAAWTMTLSDMAGDVGPKVRHKLSQWCAGSNNYQRDTAARVYASGLEQAVLAWSMFDLARIAKDGLQKPRFAVAAAVNQLYRPERAGWILAELDDWTETEQLQVHAARALLALTARADQAAPDGRPDLLERLAEESVDIRHLGRLWLVAFLEPDSAPAAAETLAGWIGHADTHDEYRPQVIGLLGAICTVPVLRQRIEFFLEKTPELKNGLPEWIRQERRQDS